MRRAEPTQDRGMRAAMPIVRRRPGEGASRLADCVTHRHGPHDGDPGVCLPDDAPTVAR